MQYSGNSSTPTILPNRFKNIETGLSGDLASIISLHLIHRASILNTQSQTCKYRWSSATSPSSSKESSWSRRQLAEFLQVSSAKYCTPRSQYRLSYDRIQLISRNQSTFRSPMVTIIDSSVPMIPDLHIIRELQSISSNHQLHTIPSSLSSSRETCNQSADTCNQDLPTRIATERDSREWKK
jgi:hypothetical protein